jgi:hypothetical protein
LVTAILYGGEGGNLTVSITNIIMIFIWGFSALYYLFIYVLVIHLARRENQKFNDFLSIIRNKILNCFSRKKKDVIESNVNINPDDVPEVYS